MSHPGERWAPIEIPRERKYAVVGVIKPRGELCLTLSLPSTDAKRVDQPHLVLDLWGGERGQERAGGTLT